MMALTARRVRRADVLHHHRQDRRSTGDQRWPQRNTRTALMMALLAAAMVGLAFASVPLYRLFCQVTGFGGTPLRASEAPGAVARPDRGAVRRQHRPRPAVAVRAGAVHGADRARARARTIALSRATTLARGRPRGEAVFNVTPAAGRANISARSNASASPSRRCKPGESVDMPVIFFVDPKLRDRSRHQGHRRDHA